MSVFLFRRMLLPVAAAAALAGCASQAPLAGPPAPEDPWEAGNRSVYELNQDLDRAMLRPVAVGYTNVTPIPVRRGVSNVMANLGYPAVFINGFLQGKFVQGGSDVLRFVLNSTVGVAGIFDVATPAGLRENDEDFGQTLAVWGVPSGPYVMIPFFGPSTARDAPALVMDFAMDIRNYLGPKTLELSLLALDVVDLRARLLGAEDLIGDSYDPYLTVRDAWLQRRRYLIYDGDPPIDDPFEDEFLDEFLEEDEIEPQAGGDDKAGETD